MAFLVDFGHFWPFWSSLTFSWPFRHFRQFSTFLSKNPKSSKKCFDNSRSPVVLFGYPERDGGAVVAVLGLGQPYYEVGKEGRRFVTKNSLVLDRPPLFCAAHVAAIKLPWPV